MLAVQPIDEIEAAQETVIGVEVLRSLACDAHHLGLAQLRRDRRHDPLRHAILEFEDVIEPTFDPVGPQDTPAFSVAEFRGNANAILGAADAAGQHVPDTEILDRKSVV